MAQEFDDEVLGAPAFPGLLYLTSTHNGRLSKVPHILKNGEDIVECPDVKTVLYRHTNTPSRSLFFLVGLNNDPNGARSHSKNTGCEILEAKPGA